MKFAFVNPNWDFRQSTYFGCREPHYPLELMFAQAKVREAGHDGLLVDAQLLNLSIEEAAAKVRRFAPDLLVIPSAPSYLFWRCPQPELRVPAAWMRGLGDGIGVRILVGPHASATPAAALRKTAADVVMRGEPDETIARLAETHWSKIPGCCWREGDEYHLATDFGAANMKSLRALAFDEYPVEARVHRHHVFTGSGRGAELEFARGCPWSCTFCNKTLFRNHYREREIDQVLREIDQLVARGVDYVYFIDEIFGVGNNVRRLLEAIAERPISIGLQTRIDLWSEETLDLLGRAHCISLECGVESISNEGREELNKNCRMDTQRMMDLLIYARRHIPWVQANLVLTEKDDKSEIRRWQDKLKSQGVWVSEPVPMFPFPGSPLFWQKFHESPQDDAWEKAHEYYLSAFSQKGYSDIQEQQPAALAELEVQP